MRKGTEEFAMTSMVYHSAVFRQSARATDTSMEIRAMSSLFRHIPQQLAMA